SGVTAVIRSGMPPELGNQLPGSQHDHPVSSVDSYSARQDIRHLRIRVTPLATWTDFVDLLADMGSAEIEFLSRLDAEIAKVNLFYLEQENTIGTRLGQLKEQLATYHDNLRLHVPKSSAVRRGTAVPASGGDLGRMS